MSTRQRAMPEGNKVSQEWLAVGELTVDARYQRPLNEAKVKRIMREFDPDLIGSLLVSERDDGIKTLLDGQQRREAVHRMWGDAEKVPCLVYHGLTLAHEAEIFVGTNANHTKPRPIDLYRARITAGDADTLAVDKILARHHFKVGSGPGPRTAQCVATLMEVYLKAGPQVLDRVLRLHVDAGLVDEEALYGEVVAGLALLLARYPEIRDRRLHLALQGVSPRRTVNAARSLRAELSQTHSRVTDLVAQQLVRHYNKGLRRDRIEWVDGVSDREYWRPVT